jgi:hypothetical protein
LSQRSRRFLKQPPGKAQVLGLVESCDKPGARLAVALAAFSGLGPGQVRELALENVVELSLPGLQFSQVPARIELRSVMRRRALKWYTFLSTSSCRWLLDELKLRSTPPSAESLVVTEQAFMEADGALHETRVRWHDLRDFFHQSCVVGGMSNLEADFILGHELGSAGRFVNPSRAVDYLRNKYVEVEKRFFV